MTELELRVTVTALENHVEEIRTDIFNGGADRHSELEIARMVRDRFRDELNALERNRYRDIETRRRASLI